jgi:caspase domain-containing protein
MKKLVFILIFCLTYTMNIDGQVAGSGKASVLINNKPKPVINQKKTPVIEQNTYVQPVTSTRVSVGAGKYYALVIGINDYLDPQINSLDYCVRDAGIFYNTLTTKYTFEKENVRFLENATMAQIVNALDFFAKSVRTVDNFLIFYAGHGVWDKSSEIGFWLPSDARQNSKLAWFRNSTLRDYLREINSKHTLLITDACFGGSIFKSRAAFMDATLAVNKLYELPSRKAMTSGTLTEVPDQSAFLKYMIDRLDNNSEKYLSSEQLFSSFRIAVINNSNVIPQFGEIKDVGDEGGDFIFILKE